MKIVIRTDASPLIGSGHLMRCLTLADILARKGASVSFVMRRLAGHLTEPVRQHGQLLHLLPSPSEPLSAYPFPENHTAWLGVDWQTDATETIDAICHEGTSTDLLIVDHYALDGRWESIVGRYCRKLMVIDDLADRTHLCDILLDQNLRPDAHRRYGSLVPSECQTLFGPRFALLRDEFARHREQVTRHAKTLRNILIFFGGSDPHNLTTLTLRALRQVLTPRTTVDVIIGPVNNHAEAITASADRLDSCTVHENVTEMAPLMIQADFCIGGGGSTTWERCCLGLPTVVVASSESELQLSEHLASLGIGLCAGSYRSLTVDRLADALRTVFDDPQVLASWSAKGMKLVDGRGTERVCRKLLSQNHNSPENRKRVIHA
jgi:UDP-2,4-diacetamido-2,4,6-trideoxy-beta-L-altropyranose hydrolase